jgi:hypothetical protein
VATYRFYDIDASGRHPQRAEDCADDEEALAKARRYAAAKGCVVEVWDGSRFVGKRGAAPSS